MFVQCSDLSKNNGRRARENI